MTTRAPGMPLAVAVLALGLAACGGGSDGGTTTTSTLSVQKGGTGSGTVTGGGIACGVTCTASLGPGTAITLTATPDAGSTFASWAGCDSTAGPTCTLTVSADRTVTATFSLGSGSIMLVNSTSFTIAEAYVSLAGSGSWGTNRLVSPVTPAGTVTLPDIPVGTYDFRAVASDGISYWQTNAVGITAGGLATWTLLPPEVGSLSVVDNHCIAVDQLYVRPASSPAWSGNQLLVPLDPGGTFTLTGLPVGTYDVSAVALDGESWMTSGIEVVAGGTSTWSLYMPAGTGCLTVVNNTTLDTIDLLYDPLSPSGCTGDNWGTEQLGGVILPPGTTFTLSGVPPGAHDLRAMGMSSIGDPVDIRFCGLGVAAGGTTTWYLSFPP